MNMFIRTRTLFVFLILMAVSLPLHATEAELRVVVSIKPVHSLMAALMKGVRPPELLVGKGRVPYGYEPTQEQKANLDKADMIVWVGPELESGLEPALRNVAQKTQIITLLDSPDLKILPSRWNDTDRDPYFWLDSRNALMLMDVLTRMLMDLDYSRTHLYKRNRDDLFKKLAELDRRLEYGYRGLKGGVVLAYYDTQQYFEQAYALKLGGVLSPSPQVPVSAATLLKERNKLKEGWYACLLTEAGMNMPSLDLLIGGVDINKVELDSFGSTLEPGEDLYLQLMEHNTSLIKGCMQKTANALAAESGEVSAAENQQANIGGRFMLTDHNGNMVTEEDMKGKYQLIYFGYTFCPDVCPTSLSVLMTALKKFDPEAKRIQPYFITVDPRRDTQEAMGDYVRYFGKHLIGLRGTPAMTERVIKEFGVIAQKVVEDPSKPEKYLIDHTASLYLMAPDGRFITKFAHGITPSQLVEKLKEYMKQP
ncbi:MAG TPA: redoxin domain-containing protein [Chromatiaceae bacterium]|nr:redoxin domain-containing protein [Chromatiaceae bacterium]